MAMEFLFEYQVRDGQVAEQVAAIRVFVAAVRTTNDTGYRYASYKRPDGVRFVHFAWMVDEDALERFHALPEYAGFADGLKARMAEPPISCRLELIATSTE